MAGSIDVQLESARTLYAQGDHLAAQQIYDDILAASPDEPRALCLRGLLHRDNGNILAAETCFRRAIKATPTLGLPYQLLGDLLHNAKHLVMAADTYEKGLTHEPDNLMLLGNLAHTRLGLGHFEVCLELSRRVIAQDSGSQESWFRVGASLCRLGRFQEAVEPLRQALMLRTDCLRSRAALCVALARTGRESEGAELITATEPLLETNFDHLNQFNEVLVWLGEAATAFRILDAFVSRHPDHAGAWNLLGRLHIVTGDERVGNDLLAKAVQLAPEDAETNLTLGLQLFKSGDFQRGLELYRQRWKKLEGDPREQWWQIPAPAWQGEVMREGALQIWTEQGIGDLAMFAGFFAPLADRAPRVMIETIARFRNLFERSFPWAEIYQRDQLEPDYVARRDVRAHAPIGDLPLLLGSDMENLPGRQGYLVPDAAQMWRLRERYQAEFPGKLIVGISWRSGNKTSATTRSAELDLWQEVLRSPGLGFVSLQYGSVVGEVAAVNQRLGSTILVDSEIDPLIDLDAFVAQVAAVDLIISVDNSTVHFAGALGKPCWTLLPFVADWRWLQNRADSIWYDSVRLFRQASPEDWAGVMSAVAAALSIEAPASDRDLCNFMHRAAAQANIAPASHDAELLYRRILQINPQDAVALNGLGRIGLGAGHAEEVRPLLAAAAALAPVRSAFAHDLARAEQGGMRIDHIASRGVPDWDGHRRPDARLFLYSSGNLADDIAAAAELVALRAEIGHLVVECHSSLVPLLARRHRRISVFESGSLSAEELAGFDVTGRMSLGRMANQSQFSAPWVAADPARVASERAEFVGHFGSRGIVGLAWTQEGVWAGVTHQEWLGADLTEFRHIFAQHGYGFVILQERADARALEAVSAGLDCPMVLDPSQDFLKRPDKFAAAVAAIDVLVTPIGATAWLAAALGKPVHVLVPAEIVSAPIPPHRGLYPRSRNGSWKRAVQDIAVALSGDVQK